MRAIFSGMLGNESTKNRIGRSILERRVPHAFLIDGERGSGKYTLALNIAAALNCEDSDASSPLPCCKCNTCRRIFEGGFTDVKTLGIEDGKATIGVGEVKEFRADMYLSASESDYKVYIIRDAERMTPEAQNALLIILEEPPRNVCIILLARGTDRILTTIKSRAQYIAMSRFTPSELKNYLLKTSKDARTLANLTPERLDAVTVAAGGAVGRALELLDPRLSRDEEDKREVVLKFVSALAPGMSFRDISDATDALPDKRAELIEYLECIISAIRDMLIIKRQATGVTEFFASVEEATRYAEGMSVARLLKLYDVINTTHLECTRNANITAMKANLSARIRTLRV